MMYPKIRIPTVKLKIPGKAFLISETRTSVTFKLTLFIFFTFYHDSGLAKIVLDLDGFIREIGMRQKSFDLSAKFV